MGIFDKLFPRKSANRVDGAGFKMFTDYSPVFTSYSGGVYEQELTRAAIERFAIACSKLKPEVYGESHPALNRIFRTAPNPYMTWPKFISRLATITECDTTAAIIPGFAPDMRTVTSLWPLKFEYAEVVEYQGEAWVRFYTASGDVLVIELRKVALINKFQYASDLFGDGNAISQTMQLMHAQGEAQKFAIKNSGKIRFIGALAGQVREEDMKKKRERFVESNLSANNESGLLLYDATFTDVRQVDSSSYVISNEEMERIEQNVFNYFGTNKKILQNDFDEDTWGAYYEGKIEPWAVQVSEGLTNMLFTPREQLRNKVTLTANRLEYASNASKRNMVRDMLDRGIFSLNEAREILQLGPIEGGDIRVIRGEYINADSVSTSIRKDDRVGEDIDLEPEDMDKDHDEFHDGD